MISVHKFEVFDANVMGMSDYSACLVMAKAARFRYISFNGNVYKTEDVDMKEPICRDTELITHVFEKTSVVRKKLIMHKIKGK